MRYLFIFLFSLAFTASGCGSVPVPTPEDSSDELSGDDVGGDDDMGGDTDDTVPPAPTLDFLPSDYGYTSLPVRGTSQPYSTVFVQGGRADVATDADSSGRFCVDVGLFEQGTQTLEVRAQNTLGETSEPALHVVHHNPALAETETPAQPLRNLVAGSVAQTTLTADDVDGQLSALTDGSLATSVLLDDDNVLWFELDDVYAIEQISIDFVQSAAADGENYATEYHIYGSDEDAPEQPEDPGVTIWGNDAWGWEAMAIVEDGDGANDTFEFSTPLLARWIAIEFIEDDQLLGDDFLVAEIHVMGRSTDSLEPVVLTPTCENGGTP